VTGIFHIVLARKPIEGTIAENCLQWGCGALWVDGTRVACSGGSPSIAFRERLRETGKRMTGTQLLGTNIAKEQYAMGKLQRRGDGEAHVSPHAGEELGRFPANLILGHATGCVYKGTKKVKAVLGGNSGHIDGKSVYGKYGQTKGNGQTIGYADADGKETVEVWECERDCAVKTISEQSGVKTSGKSKKVHEEYGDAFKFGGGLSTPENQYGDTGTAARFFFNYSEQESDE